jgi:hypothetical protein
LRELKPTWARRETVAEVLEVRAETHDTRTFTLDPGPASASLSKPLVAATYHH